MKGFLLLLIGLCSVISSYADCAVHGLDVFPKQKNIKQNSLFILEGYAWSQEIILKLNTTYPIYLESGNEKIKLQVLEVCTGEFKLTQAILKPETDLKAGLEYTMRIDGDIPFDKELTRYNREIGEYEPVTYTVLAEKDLIAPVLEGQVKEVKKSFEMYGCGPSVNIIFSNPAKDDSELLVKTTVKSLKTGKKGIYYLQSDSDEINVGYGMCSGAFQFKEGDNYEVEFVFMDSAGNIADTKVDKIRFTKPKMELTYF
ncbi:hypothetical protein [Myroides marinus]|uniref:hypothetical protein n=1 Tax=Myroides marinus TaxID=703342 RepID=UPI00257699B4|nr:hypothetical protein [Myroides marinus]MDM1348717.1 hypothetical protein [Myroides marinus]MDM1363029.1 hypothetical protein [Myroides marinus]MDM1380683.1 hypothetical protein [Myroides marinus]MDM1387939.1 hypothetical protein [Myroides marinus]MDM1395151.1 hypothetical protein [Myroides marinus]